MGYSERFSGRADVDDEDEEPTLTRGLREVDNHDTSGMLYMIEETMQEAASKMLVVKEAYIMENRENEPQQELDDNNDITGNNVSNSENNTQADHSGEIGVNANDTISSNVGSHRMTYENEVSSLGQQETIHKTEMEGIEKGDNDDQVRTVTSLERQQTRSSQHSSDSYFDDEDECLGIFGTPVRQNQSKWRLTHYLESVASTREKRIVAVSAWIIALVGLIVSLGFVTVDFIQSRMDLASTIRYDNNTVLNLPSIWICSIDSSLPSFINEDLNSFEGQPLFWIDFIIGGRQNVNYTYSQLKKSRLLEERSVDISGKKCEVLRRMDPKNFMEEITSRPKCFSCLIIHRTPVGELSLVRDLTRSSKTSKSSISIRMSSQLFLSKCRLSQLGLSKDAFSFFKAEIKLHHKKLEELKVLDFNGFDPTKTENDQYLWPLFRAGYKNTTYDFTVYDIVDMFCNVYLFGGLFYPSTESDIKYKFNKRYLKWERSGTGPYYPPVFSDFYGRANFQSVSESPVIGDEKFENRSMYDGQTFHVMTKRTRKGGLGSLASLQSNRITTLQLSKSIIKGKEVFESSTIQVSLHPNDVRTQHFVYFLNIGIQDLLTKTVTDEQTVSWSAFIADFFGLTSMFLDISVYTLIVSPLIMRARRKALLARSRNIS